MILDKVRNRFGFNILVVWGWITFCFYMSFFYPEGFNTKLGDPFAILLILNFIFNTILFVMFVVPIFAIEFVINKRITNQKFLKSKIVFCLQILGIIFFAIPLIIFGYLSLDILFTSIVSFNFCPIISYV